MKCGWRDEEVDEEIRRLWEREKETFSKIRETKRILRACREIDPLGCEIYERRVLNRGSQEGSFVFIAIALNIPVAHAEYRFKRIEKLVRTIRKHIEDKPRRQREKGG